MTNQYADRVRGMERIFKNLRWHAERLRSSSVHGGRIQYLTTSPDFPSKRASIHAYAQKLRWVVTNVDRPAAIMRLAFHDTTCAEPQREGWVNGARGDIAKSTLDVAHRKVFGYGVAVDPLHFKGLMLEKSEANAAHDGREVKGPIDNPVGQRVYQRIIDNRLEDGRFADYRVVVIGEALPCVYCKVKAVGLRYTNETAGVSLLETDDVFSAQEQTQLLALCREMGVDFAELDVLRDRCDGHAYVVDVNPTPYGPPAELRGRARKRAITLGAVALDQLRR
jgi:hypothetical protein